MNVQVRIRRHRALDQQGRRQAVPVEQDAPAIRARTERHDAVRARLVDGVAADLRSRRARTPRFLGDGLVRRAGLRLLVRRHGGLRPLRQGARHQCDIANGADDCRAAATIS